ncbi:MAG: hypothetical protein ACFCD0_15030 [Gemmataceae bacterium]
MDQPTNGTTHKSSVILSALKLLIVLLVLVGLIGLGLWYYFSPKPVSKVQFAKDESEVCHVEKQMTLRIVVTPPSPGPISLTYQVAERYGDGRTDAKEKRIVLPAETTEEKLVLSLPKDEFDRLDSRYTVTLVKVAGGELGVIRTQTVKVIDCTPKLPRVFLGPPRPKELKSGEITIPVRMQPPPKEPINVSYTFQAEPSALVKGYQVLSKQPLEFKPGDQEHVIRILVRPLKETSGTLVVRLGARRDSLYQKRAPYQQTIKVLENFDAPQIFAKFERPTVTEGATKKAKLVFNVQPPVQKPITVKVTAKGSARNKIDFEGLPYLIQIPKRVAQFEQPFDVLDNTIPQTNRVLELQLATDSTLARLQDTQATLTIEDDETSGNVLLLVPFTKHVVNEWKILEPQLESLLRGKLKSSLLGRGMYLVDAEGRTRVWRPGEPPPTTESAKFVKLGLGQHPANGFVPCFKVLEKLSPFRKKNDFTTIILYRSEEIPDAMKGRGGRHDKLYNKPSDRTVFVFWVVSEPLKRRIRRDPWLKKQFNPVVDREGWFGDRVVGFQQLPARVEGIFEAD